jgi:hypothetical protein
MKDKPHYKNVGAVLLVLMTIAFLYKITYLFLGTLVLGIVLFSFEKLAILFSDSWMKLGKFLGDINSRIVLSIFFLLILSPMALLKKIFNANKKEGHSTWVEESEEVNFTKPW